MLGFKLKHVNKRGPMCSPEFLICFTACIWFTACISQFYFPRGWGGDHEFEDCFYALHYFNRPISQIPKCICAISHNATFCNRNVHMCAHFCYKMVHCGIFVWCILGFVRWVYYAQDNPKRQSNLPASLAWLEMQQEENHCGIYKNWLSESLEQTKLADEIKCISVAR